MSKVFSALQAYIGRVDDEQTSAVIGTLEQILGQARRELDGRSITLLATAAPVSTAANVLELDLASFTFEAGRLDALANYVLKFSLIGYKPNLHEVTLKLYIDGIVVDTLVTTYNNALIGIDDVIMINAQNWLSKTQMISGVFDFTHDVVVKFTAKNTIASAGDFVLKLATIEMLKTLT